MRRSPRSIPDGTPFQRAVWRALTKIPHGQTRTYGQIAKSIGRPRAVRAVGTAVGRNPLPVVIPCHRVIPASGGIGQYRWGVARKRALLERERRQRRCRSPQSLLLRCHPE